MAGDEFNTDATDKPFGITNIRNYVPITLDFEELNYDTWCELFTARCISFGVKHHISKPASQVMTSKWELIDNLVKLWIFGTIRKSLLQMVLKPRMTSYDLWKGLEDLFRDNKDSRAMQLDQDLQSIEIGDMSIHDYCHKIKVLSDLLANIDQPVPEKNLVIYMINGLGDKFDNVSSIIRHQ
ncbi:hypothetical protein Lser_V15G06423 [Lactuca serriola]